MSIHGEHATSVMQFCAANRDKYRELLATGDIAEHGESRESTRTINQRYREAKELVLSGMSQTDAAEQVGINRFSLGRRLKKEGISSRAKVGPKKQITPEINERMKEDRRKGLKLREIASKYGFSIAGVAYSIKYQ